MPVLLPSIGVGFCGIWNGEVWRSATHEMSVSTGMLQIRGFSLWRFALFSYEHCGEMGQVSGYVSVV